MACARQQVFTAHLPELPTAQPELGFSSSRGENIHLSEDLKEVSWFARRSGSYIYASQCLQTASVYDVEINGSGHVDIGIVTVNPEKISCESRHPSFRRMNEVKVHKRTFSIYIRLENNQVISRYNDEEYNIKLKPETSAWIAIYPKFGEITVTIKGETHVILSRTHGNNIRLAENDTKAMTINKCPAAISFLNFLLRPNYQVRLQCLATTEGSKKPSRFHFKIMAHRNDPHTLFGDFKGTFDTSVKSVSEPPWTGIDSLDRDVCEGTISVILTDNRSIVCSTDRGYRKEMSLPFDASGGVWLIFELYRVSLRLRSISDLRGTEISDGTAYEHKEKENKENVLSKDEPDSVNPVYNGNENAHVDEPNDTNIKVDEPKIQKCRPELSLNVSRQHNFESSNPLVFDASALQEGIQRIEKSVEDIRVKINTDNVFPTEMVSPDQPTPPSNPVKLNFKRNFVALLHDVKADDIIDYLFQYDIISKNLYDQILAEKVPLNANRILLRQLLNKTVDRSVFERILNDSSYKHLIPLFLSNETNTQKHA